MHIFISLKVSKTSNFVKTKPFTPDTVIAFFSIKISNQPHLRFLPVTVPNSFPILPNFSPISLFSSVGNGVVVLSPFKNTRGPAESALVLLAKGWKVLILDREPREGGVSQSGQNVTSLLQQQTLPSQRNYKASKSFQNYQKTQCSK